MDWFERLVGFPESDPEEVRQRLVFDGTALTCTVSGKSWQAGRFFTPQLSELRSRDFAVKKVEPIRIREWVGDIQSLHQDPSHRSSVFQVASQFNCLEMVSPSVTPEAGVGIYDQDPTQGPACAVSAGAGTIVRNYFVEIQGQRGQSRDLQVDCLEDLAAYWQNDVHQYWRMENGYCLPTSEGLRWIETSLNAATEIELDRLRGMLRVGVQQSTEVTTSLTGHKVNQVFCSALPVAYSELPIEAWNHFPRLILDATYEATFRIAAENYARTGCNRLFLTLIGGGVFGNRLEWILSAIQRSLLLHQDSGLDVFIVSYGASKPEVRRFVESQT